MKRFLRAFILFPPINHALRLSIKCFGSLANKVYRKGRGLIGYSGIGSFTVMGVPLVLSAKGDTPYIDKLYYEEFPEQNEARLMSLLFTRSQCFYDIGANLGIYSILAAKLNPSLKIQSVEADPIVYARLMEHITKNQVSQQVSPHHVAIGDHEGHINLSVPQQKIVTTTSSIIGQHTSHFLDRDAAQVQVPLTTLDAMVYKQKLPAPDLIKIDIELAENLALIGARKILEEHKPNLIMEVFNYEVKVGENPTLSQQLTPTYTREIMDCLRHYGYHFFVMGTKGILYVEDLFSNQDANNYCFTTKLPPKRYYPWREADAFVASISI